MVLLKSIFCIGVVVGLTRACTPKSEPLTAPKPLKESECILRKANLDSKTVLEQLTINSFDACRKKCVAKELCSYFGFDFDQNECKLYLHPTKTSSPKGQVYFGRPNCEDEKNFSDWEPYPCSSSFPVKNNFTYFYKNVEHFYCKKAISNTVRSNSKIFKSLYDILTRDHENLLFSPYSVINILMLFMAGIEPKSVSKLQILNAAGFFKEVDQINTDGMNMLQSHIRDGNTKHGKTSSENRIFYSTHEAHASQDFLKTIQKIITNTTAFPIDFYEKADAVNTINDWVKAATNNLITSMVDENSFSAETIMMFLNAVYFQGNWEHQFPVDGTSVSQFRMPNGPSAGVYMMKQTNQYSTLFIPDLKAEAIELKYLGGKNSMIIMLPNNDDGLPFLEENLKNFDFNRLEFGKKEELDLHLPRFAFDSVIKMDDALRNLGITDIFDPQRAKFLRFNSTAEMWVSDIIQKAVIKVDEVGTEAASVTSVGFELTSGNKKRFIVDHPFFFIIRDNPTGLILFGGRINDATNLNQ